MFWFLAEVWSKQLCCARFLTRTDDSISNKKCKKFVVFCAEKENIFMDARHIHHEIKIFLFAGSYTKIHTARNAKATRLLLARCSSVLGFGRTLARRKHQCKCSCGFGRFPREGWQASRAHGSSI